MAGAGPWLVFRQCLFELQNNRDILAGFLSLYISVEQPAVFGARAETCKSSPAAVAIGFVPQKELLWTGPLHDRLLRNEPNGWASFPSASISPVSPALFRRRVMVEEAHAGPFDGQLDSHHNREIAMRDLGPRFTGYGGRPVIKGWGFLKTAANQNYIAGPEQA